MDAVPSAWADQITRWYTPTLMHFKTDVMQPLMMNPENMVLIGTTVTLCYLF